MYKFLSLCAINGKLFTFIKLCTKTKILQQTTNFPNSQQNKNHLKKKVGNSQKKVNSVQEFNKKQKKRLSLRGKYYFSLHLI